jgi:hypothetical protein
MVSEFDEDSKTPLNFSFTGEFWGNKKPCKLISYRVVLLTVAVWTEA